MTRTSATPDELGTLKEEFLASLNHEIRTPLSGVIGMVDLLLETELTGEQKEYLDDARLCAENLLEILNATLEFSALSADQVALEESEFSLRSMLDSLLDEFAFKAKSKGLRLIRDFSPNAPEVVCGDALRLQQILSQVVANAIKFTARGEVAVSFEARALDETGLMLNVRVRDTGIGIAPEKLDRIFDSFHQLETGLARRYTGMGLGLAVAQKLVTLMGGEIGVNSVLGEGTEFSIRIPLNIPCEPPANRSEMSGSGRFRILVVEDDPVAQTIALHLLSRRAYHVDCVSSGAEAVRAARNERYDLVLMDLQLPEMDGFETTARIRSLPGHRQTPVVALTANCSPECRDLCLRHGMQDFLAKPVDSFQLWKTIETLLPVSKGPASSPAVITRIAV